jgi:PPK2 family polyphosphate:nucleotide phosphotransferase
MALAEKFIEPYCVTNGKKFRLADFDPADTGAVKSKKDGQEWLARGVKWLSEKQEILYAQDKWAVLLIFQAMDAAGKDGAIRHVMSGVNPQGCQVYSFKGPSAEELDHDFLWRSVKRLPERGRIGIHNRSYYEEVLVARVHSDILSRQKLPTPLITRKIWEERYDSIRDLEKHLARNGTIIRKFFLHVSKDEQKRRFLSRLQEPEKNWKFSTSDARERGFFDDYMRAYEEAIRATATPEAPWYVIPADNKWFTRLMVAAVIANALDDVDLYYPKMTPEKLTDLEEAKKMLLAEKNGKPAKKRK